jgi:hypothetical protein
MLAGCIVTGNQTMSTEPGWTAFSANPVQVTISGATASAYMWYRVASSEPASYAFDNTNTAGHTTSCTMAAYRGVDTSTPLDGTPTGNSNPGPTTTVTATGLTTSFTNSLLVMFAPTGQNTTSSSWTSPLTEQLDASVINWADGIQTSAGATGNKSMITSASVDATAFLAALREAAGGGGAPFPAAILHPQMF